MAWHQRQITLPAQPRGFHLITRRIIDGLPELQQVHTGLLHVFILHTSASLTINENADPDVQGDLATALDRLAPENAGYIHTIEGPDDMPAHVKATLTGSAVTIPVCDGRLVLGTWQGVYLCEHRDRGGPRKLILTLQGDERAATR